MKKNDFLKVVLVAGLMASASCTNSNATTASKPKAEVVECVGATSGSRQHGLLEMGIASARCSSTTEERDGSMLSVLFQAFPISKNL
jgi:hypothetical protein